MHSTLLFNPGETDTVDRLNGRRMKKDTPYIDSPVLAVNVERLDSLENRHEHVVSSVCINETISCNVSGGSHGALQDSSP